MMKKVTKIGMMLLAIVALFSCSSNKYSLTGKIDGTSVTEAYLSLGEVVDTVVVEDGNFVFKGSVEEPILGVLAIDGQQVQLMIENSSITIEGAVGTPQLPTLREAAITGSSSQLAFEEFVKEVSKHQTSREDYLGYCKEYINSHTDAYFTPYIIGSVASMLEAKEVKAMIDALSPEVQATKLVGEISERVEAMLAMANGGTAPDFTMNDVDGNPVKLSDVYSKSKYLLIDFWASWCGPCRKENPNVVANYNKYKAKGFDVLGVSLDNKKDAWVEAIAKDELTWMHVSDLKGWKNAAAVQYAVQSIPANFLVDNNGKIIAKNLREEDLGKKLSELLD